VEIARKLLRPAYHTLRELGDEALAPAWDWRRLAARVRSRVPLKPGRCAPSIIG